MPAIRRGQSRPCINPRPSEFTIVRFAEKRIGPGFKALRIIFERRFELVRQIDCRTDVRRRPYESTINHFYEGTTCASPASVWPPRCWNFCASRGSATSAHRPRSRGLETRTARCDGDGPRPRCSASGTPVCSTAGFSRRRPCLPAFCKVFRFCQTWERAPMHEANFRSDIILFLRTHCAIDFPPRVSPLYFRSSSH